MKLASFISTAAPTYCVHNWIPLIIDTYSKYLPLLSLLKLDTLKVDVHLYSSF